MRLKVKDSGNRMQDLYVSALLLGTNDHYSLIAITYQESQQMQPVHSPFVYVTQILYLTLGNVPPNVSCPPGLCLHTCMHIGAIVVSQQL